MMSNGQVICSLVEIDGKTRDRERERKKAFAMLEIKKEVEKTLFPSTPFTITN